MFIWLDKMILYLILKNLKSCCAHHSAIVIELKLRVPLQWHTGV